MDVIWKPLRNIDLFRLYLIRHSRELVDIGIWYYSSNLSTLLMGALCLVKILHPLTKNVKKLVILYKNLFRYFIFIRSILYNCPSLPCFKNIMFKSIDFSIIKIPTILRSFTICSPINTFSWVFFTRKWEILNTITQFCHGFTLVNLLYYKENSNLKYKYVNSYFLNFFPKLGRYIG